ITRVSSRAENRIADSVMHVVNKLVSAAEANPLEINEHQSKNCNRSSSAMRNTVESGAFFPSTARLKTSLDSLVYSESAQRNQRSSGEYLSKRPIRFELHQEASRNGYDRARETLVFNQAAREMIRPPKMLLWNASETFAHHNFSNNS